MRKLLMLASAAAALVAAAPAGAVTVSNIVTTKGTLTEHELVSGDNLQNNGPYSSFGKAAFLFDEGVNADGDHTFLLHFDKNGLFGAIGSGEVAGSFDFTLDDGETFADVFSDFGSLLASDDLTDGVLYQRDTGFGFGVTVLRGLEPPAFPLYNDYLLISPDHSIASNQYHVTYDFKNEALTLDEVRFVFSPPEVGGVSAAPEPASWALMIGGFGLAGGALRRRRTAASAA